MQKDPSQDVWPEKTSGADGRSEDLLETTWPSSDLAAPPCLASAASERHFSPGSPEETPLHKMLFLPAAALCCLCSALAAMATQLLQEDLTWRRVGERVSFSCRGTEQCFRGEPYVFWYQKRDTETFTRILEIGRDDGEISKGFNHPQEDDFSAVNKQNGWELQIQSVKLTHSATYYCSCRKLVPHRYYYIFGSGTKLFVVDQQVVKPVVSVYPAAPRAHLEGKSSLLCLASAMFPPLVRFSWKRRKENGPLEELPPAEGEQLELRESGRTAAILLLRQQESSTYKYRCYVQHEGGQVEAPTEQEVPAPAASCPPEREPADLLALQQADWSFQSQCRVKLLCLLYTVLIVKSLLFCCGLSLLMVIRNKGPSTNCTHAD
ncbi:immunoglobulin lambda-1 light chain-like [Centropristis striata]|uniref:immunoglobulin lambda-1 light chain-like n=1 Tax=Centropristis striata TaxID=184440 RepID=UPI0027E01C60|nr:immunoglobulin lambda-1 light chain-like [Centropristis striata]